MDKENDENLAREGLLSGIAAEDIEQGNSQGFSPRNTPENEPPRVLQMSQSFFVADTLEDDESMYIPPTPHFLIPSTPPAETSSKEGHDDTTLSNLDETFMEEAEKAAEPEIVDLCSQNDMTQDLPELDETQLILVDKDPPPTSSKDLEKEPQGDDDWDLRFSETQETQELLTTTRIRESKEKEESDKLEEIEDKAKSENLDLNSNDDNFIPTPVTHEQPKIPETSPDQESDDEIEPSQSCLAELQGNTYSAFRDQLTQLSMEPPTAHSTPDNTLNGGKPNPEISEIPVVPSPIVNPDGSTIVYELKESTDDPAIAEKQVSESSVVETVVAEAPAEDVQPSKEVDQLVLDLEPTEVQLPVVLVEDTQPEEKVVEPSTEDKNDEKKVDFVVDTIELMSSVDDSVCEIAKEEKKVAEVEFKVPEVMEVSQEEDVKDSKGVIAISEEPEADACRLSSDDSSEKPKKDAHIVESLPETLPTIMLPPLTSATVSRLSRKQTFQKGKKFAQIPAQFEKREKHKITTIGTFNDIKSLQNIFDKFGIVLNNEGSEAMINLRPSEELKVKETLEFTVKDHKVFLEQHLEIGSPNAISPLSSSCSSTTTATLHSGDMADISSSLSAKSATFSLTNLDSSTSLSSQEHKTSTQNSNKNSFVNIFEAEKKDAEDSKEKVELSPIKSSEAAEVQSTGRKRGGRKAAAAKPKAALPPKRKRGRTSSKSKAEEVAKTKEQVSVTESDTSVNVRPRKMRRKKTDEPPVRTPARASADVQEVVAAAESSGDAYVDSPYGSIIPGVRVMARWKDGYYYPGEVVSQEMEGRWSIRFEDNDTRVIPQENLIKIAILERGTSVFAKSQDDYYDPGIVCGHFREGTNVGYEVELDDGVTKRYPRTSVILSTDQAKLITSSRPPTTPATVTINLDNIIDGKRKRKSLQSPERNPIPKKSPRVTRTSKFDPNLSESCSSANEKKSSLATTTSTETEEESVRKERSTRKRRAAQTGASKISLITQSATKNSKLFKDYAFLLTNAERKKPVSKPSRSDYEPTEDEEVVPFDKDELVNYITSRGGTVLESFDDVQKCKKKNIYLLANTYLRTMKYIKCIAAGVPCIKHHWVQDCCYKGEILNLSSYKLPAGKSLVTDQIVEWHGKNDVLKDVKISLISAAENPFVFNWAPVLLAAKAEFVQKWNLPSSKSGSCLYVDVLVTNPQCPTDVLQSAKKRKVPIVSSEWIIQTLIAGKRLPYNAHPKFKYDFVE